MQVKRKSIDLKTTLQGLKPNELQVGASVTVERTPFCVVRREASLHSDFGT